MNIGTYAAQQLYNAINNAVNRNTEAAGNQEQIPSSLPKTDPMLQKGMDLLSDMSVGDILTGEILKTDGSKILLSLGQGAAIEAQLQQGVAASEGQVMSFLLKGTDPSKISLSPLYSNLSSNPTADAALSEAGLPVTEKMQYMVRSMMEEGLPIDKQSLYDMNKVMNQHPEVDPMDLARMQRLNIPLTDEMITQFEHYRNYEHQITNSLSDISNAFSESFSQVLTNEGPDAAVSFFDNVMKLMLPEEEGEAADPAKAAGEAVKEEAAPKEEAAVKAETPQKEEAMIREQAPEEAEAGKEGKILSDRQTTDLVNTLKSAGFSEELTGQIKNGSLPEGEILKKVLQELEQRPEHKDSAAKADTLQNLTKNEGFRELMKDSLGKQWLLRPDEVTEDGKVSKLYEKINSQVKSLTDSLSNAGKQDTPLFQAANNVSQNINFMNEVNQAFNYVQIPLKMENGEKAGELYVYSNKKSLAEKEGNVSALLHLDMEYLGPLDVHVALQDYTKVTTRFFLKDESSLDLIAEHIDMLNERLNNRGYSMSAEFINKDEHKTLIDNMTESSGAVPVYSQTTLDIRA